MTFEDKLNICENFATDDPATVSAVQKYVIPKIETRIKENQKVLVALRQAGQRSTSDVSLFLRETLCFKKAIQKAKIRMQAVITK